MAALNPVIKKLVEMIAAKVDRWVQFNVSYGYLSNVYDFTRLIRQTFKVPDLRPRVYQDANQSLHLMEERCYGPKYECESPQECANRLRDRYRLCCNIYDAPHGAAVSGRLSFMTRDTSYPWTDCPVANSSAEALWYD